MCARSPSEKLTLPWVPPSLRHHAVTLTTAMSSSQSLRIADLPAHIGTTVNISAWVTHLPSSGKAAFVEIRDGTGTLQCILAKNDVSPETWETFALLTQETSVRVQGAVRADARSPGGVELGISGLEVVGESPLDYPI